MEKENINSRPQEDDGTLQLRHIDTVTQVTLENMPEVAPCGEGEHHPSEEELSQENIMINPDVDSMEERG